MRGRAGAGRAIGHLVGIGFRIGDEFLEVLHRQILARDQRDRRFGKKSNRREILGGVVKRLLVKRLVLRVRADARQDHVVAVGRGIRDALAAIHAAGAADIFDHHLLAEHLAHARREHAPDRVLRAARRERNDHGDRPGRKVLRIGGAAKSQQTGNGCTRNHMTHAHERSPSFAALSPCPAITPQVKRGFQHGQPANNTECHHTNFVSYSRSRMSERTRGGTIFWLTSA